MKILLIALYDYYSIGIRGLHSFLESKGHKVASFYFKNSTYTDGMYTYEQFGAMIQKMIDLSPDIIGVGVRSPVFPIYRHLEMNIRKHLPDCELVIGGAHPTGDPERCLPYADYVVVGDGEFPMLNILDDPCCPAGIVGPVQTKDLDSLPFQYYGPETLAFLKPKPTDRLSVYTTRGCSFNCTYCQESILTRKPVRKSVKYFKEEIKYFLSLFPDVGVFTVTDPTFIYDLDWLEEFASEFSGMGLTFWAAGHAQVVTPEMLKLAKAGGVKFVRIGVQSGSRYIRENVFNRKETLAQILDVAEKLEEAQIIAQYDFIIDNPFDDSRTLKETRDFIKRLPFSAVVNKFELRYWPGTEITKRALQHEYIEPEDVEGNFVRLGNWVYLYNRIAMGE